LTLVEETSLRCFGEVYRDKSLGLFLIFGISSEKGRAQARDVGFERSLMDVSSAVGITDDHAPVPAPSPN
jgi:hypothetical protein